MFYDTERMSNFVIKVYDKDFVFKRTIPRSEVEWDIAFTSRLNYGFWDVVFKLYGREETQDTDGTPIDNLWVEHWDVIKIIDPDQNVLVDHWTYKSVDDVPIYTGLVGGISRVILERDEYHLVKCYGLQTIMNTTLYDNGAGTTFTKTDDPSDILTEILDLFPDHFSYTGVTIPAYWTTVVVDFTNETCTSAVKKLLDITGWKIRFDWDGTVYFFEQVGSPTVDHNLSFGFDVSSLLYEEDSTEIINDVTMQYDWGTEDADDATSISDYGTRKAYITQTEVKDATTAVEYANAYIAKHKDPRENIKIMVNNRYEFGTIFVGQVVNLRGDPVGVGTKYVEKVEFAGDHATLRLYEAESIERSLGKLLWL